MCRASYYRYDVGLVWCSLPTERIKAIHEHHVHLLQSKEVRTGLMKSRFGKWHCGFQFQLVDTVDFSFS